MPVTPVRVSAASKEFIRTPVVATESGAAVDPTSDVVEFAFVTVDAAPSGWVAGSWETAGSLHYARCLIGPGGTTVLGVAIYDAYVRITDAPERPALFCGRLEIY